MLSWSRREAIGGGAGALILAACTGGALAAGPRKALITTWRSPTCGCCMKWIEAVRAAGYPVTVIETQDIWEVKSKLGVPRELASCHTSRVGGYVVEGHMPLEAMARLLRDRPKGMVGIALAGMPAGSPGMEVPSGRKDPFNVMAFDRSGKASKFSF